MERFKGFMKGCSYVCGAVSLFYGLFPLIHRVFNVGSAALVGVGFLLPATAALWDASVVWNRLSCAIHAKYSYSSINLFLWWRRLRWLIVVGLLGFTVMGAVVSGMMMIASHRIPQTNATVVVLGCKVNGDQPSLMLKRRLDEALRYLLTNPSTSVVCSGGRDQNNLYSEAMVMSLYLQENGISEERIYLEENSTSTEENIRFSSEIVRKHQLSPSLAVATDAFHQYRAQYFAKVEGMTTAALPAKTPWGIVAAYWVREWFGIWKAWLLP